MDDFAMVYLNFVDEGFSREMLEHVARDFETLRQLTYNGHREPLVEMVFLETDSDMAIRIRLHNIKRILFLKKRGLLPKKLPMINEDEDIDFETYIENYLY